MPDKSCTSGALSVAESNLAPVLCAAAAQWACKEMCVETMVHLTICKFDFTPQPADAKLKRSTARKTLALQSAAWWRLCRGFVWLWLLAILLLQSVNKDDTKLMYKQCRSDVSRLAFTLCLLSDSSAL